MKLTSRERIATHKKRFGGCGVFRKTTMTCAPKMSTIDVAKDLDLDDAPRLRRMNMTRAEHPKRKALKQRLVVGSRLSQY